MRARVAGLGAGNGGTVVIEGRAGVGKSALIDSGLAYGRAPGYDVRAARARSRDREVPGATIRRLGALTTGDARALAADLVAQAGARPLIVAVDDLHDADETSIDVLVEIAEQVEDLKLLLMVSLRPGQWRAGDQRLDRLHESAGEGVLRPRPLSAAGVARVLEEAGADPRPETVEEQARWTAGNPSLLAAVARSGGVRAIPDTVGAAVRRELRQLPSNEVSLARALSILGPPAPLRRAARLADLDRAAAELAADRLARRGLLAPGDPLRFHAPIEGAAIALAMEPFERARAHRDAARVLLEDGAGPEEVADHLLATSAAGDAEVVAGLAAAAEQALAAGDPDRAARYLERAVGEPPAAHQRDATVIALVGAEARGGRPASVDRLERALDRLADSRLRVEALRQLATLQFLRSEPDRAAATVRRGLDLCGGDDPLRDALLGEHLAAASFVPRLRPAAAARLGEIMEVIATGGSPPGDSGLLVQVVGAMAVGGTARSAVLELVESLLRTEPAWDGPPFGLFADWIVGACLHVDDLERAEQVATGFHDDARRAGDVVRQGMTNYRLGLIRLHQGRLPEAVTRLEAALRRRDDGWTSVVPWAAAALSVAQVQRGRLGDAARALDHARDADPDGLHAGVLLEARGHLALATGDPAAALAHYEASGRHLADCFLIDAPTMITWRADAAFAISAQHGDLRRARLLADTVLDRARATGGPRQQARALRAGAAARPGTQQALRLLEEARSVTAAVAPRLERVHVLADLGAALLAAGDPKAARDPLKEALEAAEAGGIDALAVRVRRLLRATGTRPRRSARAGAGTLTAAELQVATLAASGHSNRKIAEIVTVSERTVESHLYNAFGKLGVHRREDLTRHLPPDSAP